MYAAVQYMIDKKTDVVDISAICGNGPWDIDDMVNVTCGVPGRRKKVIQLHCFTSPLHG